MNFEDFESKLIKNFEDFVDAQAEYLTEIEDQKIDADLDDIVKNQVKDTIIS